MYSRVDLKGFALTYTHAHVNRIASNARAQLATVLGKSSPSPCPCSRHSMCSMMCDNVSPECRRCQLKCVKYSAHCHVAGGDGGGGNTIHRVNFVQRNCVRERFDNKVHTTVPAAVFSQRCGCELCHCPRPRTDFGCEYIINSCDECAHTCLTRVCVFDVVRLKFITHTHNHREKLTMPSSLAQPPLERARANRLPVNYKYHSVRNW